ncbi:MAG: FISUMP domain-containing protein [Candidatus Gracilibacteria bacterium]|nr:FISUMP domain-containing protein [Candidatus Gracilibacteria bacterium]MDD2909161.1 FISUMP domain-containing protein [Candidatus Gracilibacteria bacterium]
MKTPNKQYSVPFIKGEQKGIKILKTKNYKQKTIGFTLVELIVVIVILAILSTIAFLSFNSYSSSSRDSVRITDINSLKKSMELFSIKAGTYPTPDNGVNVTYSGGIIWTQGTLGDKATKLISTISKKPTDPLSSKEYTYSLLSNKREFQIAANFENPVSYRDNMKMNNKYLSVIPEISKKLSGIQEDEGFNVLDYYFNNNENDSNLDSRLYGNDNNLLTSFISKLSNPYIQQAIASSTGEVCYINGNFNGLVAKASTGVINVILAVPSLIVVDTTNSGNLVYDDTFGEGKLQCNGVSSPCNINFNSTNIVFSGSPANTDEIRIMMEAIQTAYSGSNITSIPTIKNLLEASGTTLTDLGSGLIKNNLGTSKSVTVITPTYSCNTAEPSCSSTGCTLITGTPTSVNQVWVKDGANCGFSCIAGYSGNNCEIPPSCNTALPTCSPAGCTLATGTPTSLNQAWVKGSSNCGFTCKTGYSGDYCNLQWRDIPGTSCSNDDYVFTYDSVTYRWAGCNSVLGTGFERGYKNDGSTGTISATNGCYNYVGVENEANCIATNPAMASSAKEKSWSIASGINGTVDNIWGKLYTWSQAKLTNNACPTGWHLPSDNEWTTLELALAPTCTDATSENTWRCTADGLGWAGNISKTTSSNIVQALKIPLGGNRDTNGYVFYGRGYYTYLWSSSTSGFTAYRRLLHWNYAGVGRNLDNTDFGYSVRCIKD